MSLRKWAYTMFLTWEEPEEGCSAFSIHLDDDEMDELEELIEWLKANVPEDTYGTTFPKIWLMASHDMLSSVHGMNYVAELLGNTQRYSLSSGDKGLYSTDCPILAKYNIKRS